MSYSIGYDPPVKPLVEYICPGCDEPTTISRGDRAVHCGVVDEDYPWQGIYVHTVRHWALRAEAALKKLEDHE